MSLVEKDIYKKYLKIELSDDTYDDVISDTSDAIDQKVISYLSRDLTIKTYTNEYYDGDGLSKLILNQYPITDIISIQYYDGIIDDVESWVTMEKDIDYDRVEIKDDIMIYLDGGYFRKGTKNIKVTYKAGYATIPADISLACKKLMKLYLMEKDTLGVISKSEGVQGSFQTTYKQDTEESILKSINFYRTARV